MSIRLFVRKGGLFQFKLWSIHIIDHFFSYATKICGRIDDKCPHTPKQLAPGAGTGGLGKENVNVGVARNEVVKEVAQLCIE